MSAIDLLEGVEPSHISGCAHGGTVTPSDTNDLPFVAKALYAGSAGTICFIPVGNSDTQTITVTLAANQVFDMFRVRRVMSTGTNVNPIIAGWG